MSTTSPPATPDGTTPDGATPGRAAEHTLRVENLSTGYGGRTVVHDVDLEVPTEEISVIIGANACGKSTLLKTMARLLAPTTGSVQLDGERVDHIPTRQLARTLGLLPQTPIAPEGIAVADLISRGRQPYQRLFAGRTAEDTDAIAKAMEVTRTAHLANRTVDELSGGQRQRVWIAMALAQQTDVLLLDEPTTFLDLAKQVEVLDLLTELNRTRGTTIVMVLHDINLAARYADHLFAMRDGRLIARGTPGEVITPELVKEVFDLEAHVMPDPTSGAPMLLPIGRFHTERAHD